MSTSTNKFDALEHLIFEKGLHIVSVDTQKESDLLIIRLNTNILLRRKLSSYHRLKNATADQLSQYELIGKGFGVHWPSLDEDLSLKGFLLEGLSEIVTAGNMQFATAA